MGQVYTLPMFPLDGVLLCPGLLLPLHVFEPRYREMVAFALDHDSRIAMSLPGLGHSIQGEFEPPVHEICGLGEILQHQTLPDGRSNILLRGLTRMRILEELPKDHPFRVVRAMVLPEELPEEVDLSEPIQDLLGSLTRLGASSLAQLRDLPPQQIVDSVLVGLPLPDELKLDLFSEPRVEVRLRRLLDNLPGAGKPDVDIGPTDPRRN